MKIMKKLLILILLLFIFPLTSSVFYVKDLFPIYNIGDSFNFNVTIFEQVSGQYFFQILFSCDGKELTYFAIPLMIEAGKQQELIIPSSLVTEEMLGKCTINLIILDGSARIISKSEKQAEITNKIIVETNFTREVLPSSFLYIEGKARLANGKIFNGSSSLEFYNSTYKAFISEGNFSFSFVVPEKIKTGEHEIKIFVEDGKGNVGMIKEKINIMPLASKLILELNNETFLPEEKIFVRPILFDQGDDLLKKNITIKIFSEKREIFSSVTETNKSVEYIFKKIAPGKLIVTGEYEKLKAEKEIEMLGLKKIKMELYNETLFVENIGNVLYAENLLVTLEGINESINFTIPIILDVGKNVSYELEAPTGVYDVSIGEIKWKNVPLTGKVAAAIEIGKKSWLAENPMKVVFFLLFVILLIILISQRKLRNEIFALVKRETLARKKAEFQQFKAEQEKKKIENIFSKYVDKEIAEKLMTGELRAKKQEATFLFTDIRNYSEISESSEIIDILHNYFDIVSKAVHSYGGIVNRMFGDAVICIFNIKKQEQHELAAVRAASRIMQEMEKLNKKLERKGEREIKIGIGIDSGEVIMGDLGSYIKSYQPIGKPVNVAYRLSSKGVNKILITKTINDKISNFIKTKRLGIFELKGVGAIEVFVVE